MGLTAKQSGNGSFEPVKEGVHQAMCYAVYDIGTHYNERFSKSVHQCVISFEIPSERIEIEKDGKKLDLPRAISKTYTVSLHEKAELRKDLERWRGKMFTSAELDGFDLTNLLGANCMIQVIHKEKGGKTYANIAGIMSLASGMTKKTPENAIVYFSFEDDVQIPENAPPWIADLIKSSEEWKELQSASWPIDGQQQQHTEVDDDIPF